MVLALLLCIVLFASSSAAATEVSEMLKQYRCYLCHDDRDVGAGPAFVDVAKRYRGHRHAASVVAFRIRAGSSSGGPWHMPPHPEVSRRDAEAMARYILSLKE